MSVSPNEVDAQVPFELIDTNSSSLYVRTQHNDGSVSVTTAVGLPISQEAPGIYAGTGPDSRPAVAAHYSSYAAGVISVDGTVQATDVVSVTIENRPYVYTVLATDTFNHDSRRVGCALVNANSDEKVIASPSGSFTRIVLRAKVPGSEGNGIVIAANATGATTTSSTGVVTVGTATETMTAINSNLCCANVAGSPITLNNPAVPGELIAVYATGLRLGGSRSQRWPLFRTASALFRPRLERPQFLRSPPSSAVARQTSALYAGLQVEIHRRLLSWSCKLDSALPTNPVTQITISQDIYTSNIAYIPVVASNPAN